jgi:hypothetical protein
VPQRDEQVDPLLGESAGEHVRAGWQRRGQAEVQVAVAQPREQLVPAVLHEPEAHLRVRCAEVLQQLRHDLGAEGVQEAERDPATRRVRLAGHVLDGGRQGGERSFGGIQQVPAVPGQLDRTAGAGEQRQAKLGFQPGDRPGESRLGDSQ